MCFDVSLGEGWDLDLCDVDLMFVISGLILKVGFKGSSEWKISV